MARCMSKFRWWTDRDRCNHHVIDSCAQHCHVSYLSHRRNVFILSRAFKNGRLFMQWRNRRWIGNEMIRNIGMHGKIEYFRCKQWETRTTTIQCEFAHYFPSAVWLQLILFDRIEYGLLTIAQNAIANVCAFSVGIFRVLNINKSLKSIGDRVERIDLRSRSKLYKPTFIHELFCFVSFRVMSIIMILSGCDTK